MSYKIEISSLAEEEYSSAFQYYQEQQPGLGLKFEKETDYLIAKLKINPHLFQRKYKHYREAVFRRFPYFIVYEIVENTVIVQSFFHTHRHPRRKLKK